MRTAVLNTAGIAFLARAMKASGKDVGQVFGAFYSVAEATGASKTRAAIMAETLDAPARQAKLRGLKANWALRF